MQGARSIVVNITGGADLSLAETTEATGFITRVADPEANVIYGIVTNEALRSAVRVTVIATGFDREANGNGNGTADAAAGAKGKNGNDAPSSGGFMRRMWRRGGETT